MNTSKEMCNLLFLQGKLMNNLEMQISFLSHNKDELQKILDKKQTDLETQIEKLKQDIELQEKKDPFYIFKDR
ncbi:hypothetical protein [Marinobacter sp.]|jgi:fructose-1-phosphate kinase PfkB-like protein|uniref:hypothetical protein n=1 Tax=Marinobacter sp. TaxID=50741 RepID=UPI000C8F80C7|nr:hypothetical protein [Marinobacter sp.]MAK49777.1 hypothetical protein [Marinobacter sp.]|tara:strand:+ start:669 stop:887 length:219 start_codon:yes stop_codon:yes gene_type:complete